MISEIRKSIAAVLYERSSSPFYGTFIISWLVWNWKLPYVTFFVSEDNLESNKLDWIINNAPSISFLIFYPIASTFILIALMPIASNGAYWLSLRYRKWRMDKRNEVENKTLLTIEQSIALREELLASEQRIEKLLESKNNEIKQLSLQIEHLETTLKEREENGSEGFLKLESGETSQPSDIYELESIIEKIRNNSALERTFNIAIEYIQAGHQGLLNNPDIDTNAVAYLEANDLITSQGNGKFLFSDKGKKVMRGYLDQKY